MEPIALLPCPFCGGSNLRVGSEDALAYNVQCATTEIIRKETTVGRNVLPKVNRVVSLLKRWLLGTYQGGVHLSYLNYYLDEYTFRFNRRTSRSRGKLFYRLVEQAVAIGPVPRHDIRGGLTTP